MAHHLRRMRRIYGERRQYFVEQFDRYLGNWMELQPTDSGIQLVALFHDGRDGRQAALEAAYQNINVSPLSMQYRHRSRQRGLLLGFAAADEKKTKTAMQQLDNIFAASQ